MGPGFIEKGRRAADLPNWVATIAYRRSIDLLRKDTGAHRNAGPDEALEDTSFRESAEEFYENSKILEAEDNPFLDAEQFGIGKELLEKAIGDLEKQETKTGKNYRVALQKRYFDGLKLKEVAEEMGKSIGTVAGWLERAYACLKQIITSDPRGRDLAKLISKH